MRIGQVIRYFAHAPRAGVGSEEQTARNEKRERLKSIRQSCAITPSDAAGLASELGAAPPDLVRTLSDPAMPSPAKKKPL